MAWLKFERPQRRRQRWLPPAATAFAALVVAVAGWFSSTGAAAATGNRGEAPASPAASPLPQRVPTLVALGDSTAVGIGARSGSYVDRLLARLLDTGRRYQLTNLSVSGATTRDVLERQVPRLAAGTPGLVLVGVGANDLMADVPPDQFARRFEGLVAAIRARTQAAVVVSNVPDVSLSRAVWPALRAQVAARVDAYNRVIATVARRHELRVFDLCRMTRERLPSHPEYLSADGYHPSDLGYQAWADGLWQVVQAAL